MILLRFCFVVRFWLGEFESACSTLQVQGDAVGRVNGACNIGPLGTPVTLHLRSPETRTLMNLDHLSHALGREFHQAFHSLVVTHEHVVAVSRLSWNLRCT